MIDPSQIALIVALLVLLGIVVSLRRMHADPASTFDLRDLLMENGRVSKAAAVMMGSFVVTTWVLVYCTLVDKHVEVIFGLYIATWVTPVVARLIKSNGNAQKPEAQTVTVTNTTTVEPKP